MKRMLIALLLLVSHMSLAKSVGLWKDARSYITDGMLKTLQDAGWETVILEGSDLSDEKKLSNLDVVFLPGGWNAYYFADFNARRTLVRFVAGGKGILAGAFRSGYVRTANRPLFPEVGATHNRVNGAYVWGYGDSDLAKAVVEPFCPGGWDHLVVKVGPKGKVFAVNGEDPVGVYGDVYGGRYLIFGAFIGMDAKTEPMSEPGRTVLLKSLEWLASAPRLSDKEKAKQQASADLDFLRREMLYDWALDERGPDRSPGVLPQVRNRLAIPLESRMHTLHYMSQFLSGAELKQCRKQAEVLEDAVRKLDKKYEREISGMKSRIAKISVAELLAENPFVEGTNLASRVDSVPARTEQEKSAMMASLTRCATKRPPPYASKELAMFLHGDSISEKLMPSADLSKLVEQADKTIAELQPAVAAVKAAKMAEARKTDLAKIPDLEKACASKDMNTRLEAVVELGRIGGSGSAKTLIKMLDDPDERIRIKAITGLGWMQSKQAVPRLIELAAGNDVFMKRRAVQALGQIGDKRATDILMKNLKDKDDLVVENAIFSLGWLKAKAAVPQLLEIATSLDPQKGDERLLMLAAIRSLGYIGDPAALPELEEIVAKTDDFPQSRNTNKAIVNIYATPQCLGLNGHAQLAIELIKAGGRKEPGVRQPEYLACADKFYGLTRRFNSLAGRPETVSRHMEKNKTELWPYLWHAGFTGIHQAWGMENMNPEEYRGLMKAADQLGLIWIGVLPCNTKPYRAPYYRDNRQQLEVEKAGADLVLSEFSDIPSFQGFWGEECYPDVELLLPEFESFLKNKYGADYRKQLGVTAGENLLAMQGTNYPNYHGPLKVEYVQACGEKLLKHWRESQEWLNGLRKGCSFAYSVSAPGSTMEYQGVAGKAGTVIDVNGPENYQSFGRFNAFIMETYKDGEAHPVMCEFYNWYTPAPAQAIRGFAQHLMHGECFYNFALSHIFKQPSGDLWIWGEARWDDAAKIFGKARQIREFLNVPDSAANVATLVSELTYVSLYAKTLGHSGWSLANRWFQQQSGIWTALNQSQIPSDVIWTETMTPEKLKRYKVLVLSDAKMLTPDEITMVRDWVNDGGVLIASGTTSLFNQWAEQQKNYQLADLLGVDYVENVGVSNPEMIDTYCWKPRGETVFKAVSGLDPDNFRNHVHRDLKPVKSIGTYTVCEAPQKYLPGIAPALPIEYDMPLGYDKVKPGSAEVLASFANGDPALTVNKVGKGLCYFWTPIYPGVCYVSSQWEMQPNRLDFWPNVMELLNAMVRGGLDYRDATLPVEVSNVSKEIEVTVRQQPEHNRWMIHLLNYDPNVDLVKSPGLIVHPPEGKTVKRIFYPDTDTDVKFKIGEKDVEAKIRDFDVHDMVVVEYE